MQVLRPMFPSPSRPTLQPELVLSMTPSRGVGTLFAASRRFIFLHRPEWHLIWDCAEGASFTATSREALVQVENPQLEGPGQSPSF